MSSKASFSVAVQLRMISLSAACGRGEGGWRNCVLSHIHETPVSEEANKFINMFVLKFERELDII